MREEVGYNHSPFEASPQLYIKSTATVPYVAIRVESAAYSSNVHLRRYLLARYRG